MFLTVCYKISDNFLFGSIKVNLLLFLGWIIKKISHVHAMSLVLLALSARFILYSLLSNPWWVLPIELLQGLTFGLFYSTMASYASVVAPPGAEATVQVFTSFCHIFFLSILI